MSTKKVSKATSAKGRPGSSPKSSSVKAKDRKAKEEGKTAAEEHLQETGRVKRLVKYRSTIKRMSKEEPPRKRYYTTGTVMEIDPSELADKTIQDKTVEYLGDLVDGEMIDMS